MSRPHSTLERLTRRVMVSGKTGRQLFDGIAKLSSPELSPDISARAELLSTLEAEEDNEVANRL